MCACTGACVCSCVCVLRARVCIHPCFAFVIFAIRVQDGLLRELVAGMERLLVVINSNPDPNPNPNSNPDPYSNPNSNPDPNPEPDPDPNPDPMCECAPVLLIHVREFMCT